MNAGLSTEDLIRVNAATAVIVLVVMLIAWDVTEPWRRSRREKQRRQAERPLRYLRSQTDAAWAEYLNECSSTMLIPHQPDRRN